ncbi:MAG: ChaN family lipoprotein [Rhodoferax sp.]
MLHRVAAQVLLLSVAFLGGCAASLLTPALQTRLEALLPADALLIGEQHDTPAHQQMHREVVSTLAAEGKLAAVALEMAEQGRSTDALEPSASERAVRAALQWDDAAWNWTMYRPAVMAAVRAGVPVRGANLTPTQRTAAMDDAALDRLLRGPALKAQQQRIRIGHCGMLPESQIAPMTRIQIARDVAMAHTVTAAAIPGKTVLLLAGSGHVDRALGVPQHLKPDFKAKTLLLYANSAPTAPESIANFDQSWPLPPAPDKDYCAELDTPTARK